MKAAASAKPSSTSLGTGARAHGPTRASAHGPRAPDGCRLFGRDPPTYDRARLPYPPRVFEILRSRCGLCSSSSIFEIGPGTGIATRQLLGEGVASILAVEADPRLARYLVSTLGRNRRKVTVVATPFERLSLPEGTFDLGVAATSFHWLKPGQSLRKIARALRPGGWWAMWWNRHGDAWHPSPFHRAIDPVLMRYGTPGWSGLGRMGVRRSIAAREQWLTLLRGSEWFDRVSYETIRWPVELSSARAQALWSTFSEVSSLPAKDRRRVLGEIGRIIDDQFQGRVRFRILTPIFTAHRV